MFAKYNDGVVYNSLGLYQSAFYIPEDMAAAFPDPIFRAYVLGGFDTDYNGIISAEEALNVTYINIDYDNIESLEGIEYFINLTELDCYSNQLTTLVVSRNTALKYLRCFNNPLETLYVKAGADYSMWSIPDQTEIIYVD